MDLGIEIFTTKKYPCFMIECIFFLQLAITKLFVNDEYYRNEASAKEV